MKAAESVDQEHLRAVAELAAGRGEGPRQGQGRRSRRLAGEEDGGAEQERHRAVADKRARRFPGSWPPRETHFAEQGRSQELLQQIGVEKVSYIPWHFCIINYALPSTMST